MCHVHKLHLTKTSLPNVQTAGGQVDVCICGGGGGGGGLLHFYLSSPRESDSIWTNKV